MLTWSVVETSLSGEDLAQSSSLCMLVYKSGKVVSKYLGKVGILRNHHVASRDLIVTVSSNQNSVPVWNSVIVGICTYQNQQFVMCRWI